MALHKAQRAPSYTSLDALAVELERVLKEIGIPTAKVLSRIIGEGAALPVGSSDMLDGLATQLELSPERAAGYMQWYLFD